jgi:hypothetical protein
VPTAGRPPTAGPARGRHALKISLNRISFVVLAAGSANPLWFRSGVAARDCKTTDPLEGATFSLRRSAHVLPISDIMSS